LELYNEFSSRLALSHSFHFNNDGSFVCVWFALSKLYRVRHSRLFYCRLWNVGMRQMNKEKHSIEIIRKYAFSIRAECSCGWSHIEFLHDERSRTEKMNRFDGIVQIHEEHNK
jgi:hypothetical protein